MDESEKKEWMEDNNAMPGGAWLAFRGKAEMEFCDLRLRDKSEIGPCWPAKGNKFVDMGDEEHRIDFGEVTHIRYYVPRIPGDIGESLSPEDDGDEE